jgi:hypothetical protein
VFASFVVLVEQLSYSFLNAGRAVFAEEFDHEAVKRLHAKLKRLVANPQHLALDALQVVHYGNPTKRGHMKIWRVIGRLAKDEEGATLIASAVPQSPTPNQGDAGGSAVRSIVNFWTRSVPSEFYP